MQRLPFLGHIVTPQGIAPDPSKVDAVQKLPSPKTVTQLRSFLGLAGYYRRFIQSFSEKAKPLHKLLEKEQPYKQKDNQQEAFDTLKQKLITAPILAYPDFSKTFILATDASYHSYSATLSQIGKDKKEYPVAYTSKSLRPGEVNYGATELECAAIVQAVEYFYKYFGTSKFILVTDHIALRQLQTADSKGKIGQWILKLQLYDFEVIYKPGRIHSNVDALSRLKQEETHHST